MVTTLNLKGRLVGPGHPCLLIAEAGVNHNGELERAVAMVEAAREAGADAVKFQSFRAEEVASASAAKASYQEKNTGEAGDQLTMLRALELSPKDHTILARHCRAKGIIFLSTPFDPASAAMLADLGVPAIKISSGEITNTPLLMAVGQLKLPVFLSTGMADMKEVAGAVETLWKYGCQELALLQCTSNYPADPADANLRAMATMAERFKVPVGYSDHTLGIEISLAAVALGASVIEKHFTLDRTLPGPDHRASAEPEELAALVAGVRKVEAALGHGEKQPAASEAPIRELARRSIVALRDIAAGEVLEADALALKRPGSGLGPEQMGEVLGRKAKTGIPAGTIIERNMLT